MLAGNGPSQLVRFVVSCRSKLTRALSKSEIKLKKYLFKISAKYEIYSTIESNLLVLVYFDSVNVMRLDPSRLRFVLHLDSLRYRIDSLVLRDTEFSVVLCPIAAKAYL